MDRNLIVDIGCNNGEDAKFYSSLGYKVIAIDADPFLIGKNENNKALENVHFVNKAISDKDNEEINFYIAEDSGQSSLLSTVGIGEKKDVVLVKTATLKSIFEQYGTPYYCKIDIEGYDAVAIKSIGHLCPFYISAEGECKPASEKFSEDGVLDTLDALKSIGYTKFKLVDQTTFVTLSFRNFYSPRTTLQYKIRRKIQKITKNYTEFHTNKQLLSSKFKYNFTADHSGPFGEHLDGKWIDYEEAKKLYLFHRRDFFSKKSNHPYTFWVDWHATK